MTNGRAGYQAGLRLVPLLLAIGATGTWTSGADEPDRPAPYLDFRQRATPYSGPGRENAPPDEVREVVIAYFGPSDPDDSPGGDLWIAAQMAVEKANQQGGFRGKPFRLEPVWSPDPWKGGVGELARLAYRQDIWAIVGGIDGPAAHLAEQVVAKARLPLICAGSTDRSANLANVPWMFSMLPGDHQFAPKLVEAIERAVGTTNFALISTQDHDSRMLVLELKHALARRRMAPRVAHVITPDPASCAEVSRRVVEESPGAVMIAGDAAMSARLVRGLREAGFPGPIFGGAGMNRRQFLDEAGPQAEGVILPLLIDQASLSEVFRTAFLERTGTEPDHAAVASHDSVRMVIEAIRRTGLNRARIGDTLRELPPWTGAAGPVIWDALGSNARDVGLGTIRDGRFSQGEWAEHTRRKRDDAHSAPH